MKRKLKILNSESYNKKMRLAYLLKKHYKIWLPLLSLIIFFGIGEVISRSLDLSKFLDADFRFYIRTVDNDLKLTPFLREDALLMWSPIANYNKSGITINSDGFRDKEYKKNKNNVFRILFLGDSSTFGDSASSFSNVYHTLLEDRLNREFNNIINYECLSGGVPGYTSYQGLSLYKYKGIKYNPDIIIFYFGINDPIKKFYHSDKEIMNGKLPKSIKIFENRYLLESSFYRVIRKIITDIVVKDGQKELLELDTLAKDNGAKLIIIYPPIDTKKANKINLLSNRIEDFILYMKDLKDVTREHNIPLVIINDMNEKSAIEYFSKDGVHPNDLGHKKIMEELYNFLIQNQLLQYKKI